MIDPALEERDEFFNPLDDYSNWITRFERAPNRFVYRLGIQVQVAEELPDRSPAPEGQQDTTKTRTIHYVKLQWLSKENCAFQPMAHPMELSVSELNCSSP